MIQANSLELKTLESLFLYQYNRFSLSQGGRADMTVALCLSVSFQSTAMLTAHEIMS
jgi:hypothetical protein